MLELFVRQFILGGVNKLTRYIALMVLALWSLTAMHCKLEAVPGLEFLKTCCFADSSSTAPIDCENDGCSAVEEAKYRPEEKTASAPQPLLVRALTSPLMEAPLPACAPHPLVASRPPPELPRSWQFSFRAALAPRAPTLFA